MVTYDNFYVVVRSFISFFIEGGPSGFGYTDKTVHMSDVAWC